MGRRIWSQQRIPPHPCSLLPSGFAVPAGMLERTLTSLTLHEHKHVGKPQSEISGKQKCNHHVLLTYDKHGLDVVIEYSNSSSGVERINPLGVGFYQCTTSTHFLG